MGMAVLSTGTHADTLFFTQTICLQHFYMLLITSVLSHEGANHTTDTWPLCLANHMIDHYTTY